MNNVFLKKVRCRARGDGYNFNWGIFWKRPDGKIQYVFLGEKYLKIKNQLANFKMAKIPFMDNCIPGGTTWEGVGIKIL